MKKEKLYLVMDDTEDIGKNPPAYDQKAKKILEKVLKEKNKFINK